MKCLYIDERAVDHIIFHTSAAHNQYYLENAAATLLRANMIFQWV